TEGEKESVPLEDVFLTIRELHGEQVDLQTKTASDKELIEFLVKVLPDFDRSKVYVSDIKKVITWYNILSEYVPEIFVVSEATAEETEIPADEVAEEPKGVAAKKSSKKEKSDA